MPRPRAFPLLIRSSLAFCALAVFLFAISGCRVFQSPAPCVCPEDAWLQIPPPATEREARIEQARARRGDHYARRLAFFLDDTPARQPGGVVFIGDSITEGFPLAAAFPNQNVINRGISGDTIAGARERLDVSAALLHPREVYLLIGVNDILSWREGSIARLAVQYERLAAELKAAVPEARITLLSVFPLSGPRAQYNPDVQWLNRRIQQIAADQGLGWIDLHPLLADPAGFLRKEFTGDGVHLNVDGYLAVLEGILPGESFPAAALALAPQWSSAISPRFPITKTDPPAGGPFPGSRGADELVVYTPAGPRATTGTNQWGVEAIVEEGKVVRLNLRDSPVPPNGYVISGHGRAAEWIQASLYEGLAVERDSKFIRIPENAMIERAAASPDPRERLMALRARALGLLAEIIRAQSEEAVLAEAQSILLDIRGLRLAPSPPAADALETLGARLSALEAPFGLP